MSSSPDVYATSPTSSTGSVQSSNTDSFSLGTNSQQEPGFIVGTPGRGGSTSGGIDQAGMAPVQPAGTTGWIDQQFGGGQQQQNPTQQWELVGNSAGQQSANQQPASTNFNGLDGTFDMVTGGDRSLVSSDASNFRATGSGRSSNTEPLRGLDRSRDRNVLQSGRQSSPVMPPLAHHLSPANGSSSSINNGNKPGSLAAINTPVVPSSTTTAAPEYVMINPTRSSSPTDPSSTTINDDQDE